MSTPYSTEPESAGRVAAIITLVILSPVYLAGRLVESDEVFLIFAPLGAIVEYSPSLNETLVCFGIWAFGLLCYTLFLRMAVPILQGRLTKANEGVFEPGPGDKLPELPAASNS